MGTLSECHSILGHPGDTISILEALLGLVDALAEFYSMLGQPVDILSILGTSSELVGTLDECHSILDNMRTLFQSYGHPLNLWVLWLIATPSCGTPGTPYQT